MKGFQKTLLIFGLGMFVFPGTAPQIALGYTLVQQTQQEIDKCIIEVTEYEQKLIELENEYSIVDLNHGIYIDSGQIDNEFLSPDQMYELGPEPNIRIHGLDRYRHRLDNLWDRMDNVKEDIWFAKKRCDKLKIDLELVLKAWEKEREEAFPTGNISTLPSAKELEKEAAKNGKKKKEIDKKILKLKNDIAKLNTEIEEEIKKSNKKIPGKIKTVTPSKSPNKWYKKPYIVVAVGAAVLGGGLIALSGGGGGDGGAPTPTPTPIPPPEKFRDMSYTATINFRNLRTSGDCTDVTLPHQWSDTFHIKTENGTITINQPSVNQTDTGPIDSDGNFSAAGANSSHVGNLNSIDGSGNDTHTHTDGPCLATWDGDIVPSS